MAYSKKTWKARQGLGLNKFSIDGATPVPVINQPDSVTQQGDALSAGNLNDLEQRIADAFDDVEESKDALQSQIDQHESRLENLEQVAGDYGTWHYPNDPNHSSDMPNKVPTGKAKYGLVSKLRGVSRVKNQLVKNGNFADGTANWTAMFSSLSVSDGVASITKNLANPSYIRPSEHYNFIAGHVYLGVAWLKGEYTFIGIHNNVTYSAFALSRETPTDSEFSMCSFIYQFGTNDDPATSELAIRNGSAGSVGKTFYAKNIILTDLTVYFGGTIPSDADTIAEIQTNYPELLIPSDYDAGSLVSTTYSAVKSVGVNIWDEEWEVGSINDTTGALNNLATDQIRSKNYIPIVGGETYYAKVPNGTGRVFFYDKDRNFLAVNSLNISVSAPANAFYMKFRSGAGYGTTYNHDIQICLNSLPNAIKTTYHSYKTDTLSLSETVTLRSAGSVADTDELNVEVLVDGVKVNKRRQTTRVGGGAIGTGWSYDATRQAWNKSITGIKTDSDLLASDYLFIGIVRSSSQVQEMTVGTCAINGTIIFVKNGSDSVAPSGYLYYALATESVTLLEPIIDNFIEVEGGGTIDTIQTQTPVIDNCLDVGYLTV